jgi:hypothetical protein
VSASSIPLKIKNANGDLQELTPAEENYLAVKVGEALSLATAGDIGDISLTNGTNIGSFVDTYYNEPSGTHPMSAITGTSVTTTLKQVVGTASESGSDFARPVGYYATGSNPGFYEMVDADLDNLTNRALKNIEALGLQGAFELSSTSPGGDWTKHIDTVFSDTRGDGTSIDYHIWKKTSLSTPPSGVTTTRPVATDYDGNSSFSGFKEMSDAEIMYTLGQRAKSLRSTAGAIGSYQLRSSAQGAPSSTGTWVARGSALNTQRSITNVDYTRTRNSAYARTRDSAYTRERTEDYSGTYANTFTGNSEVTFTGNYTSGFVGNFVGNYARVSVNNSTRTRYSSYAADYAADYITVFAGNYIGNSSSDFSSSYVRSFVGDFAGNYSGTYTGTYTNPNTPMNSWYARNAVYTADYTRTSTRTSTNALTYVGNYSRNRLTAYGYVRTGYYTRTSTRTSTGAALSYFYGSSGHHNPGYGAVALNAGWGMMYWSHFFDTGSYTSAYWANRSKGMSYSGATSITAGDGYIYYRGAYHSQTGASIGNFHAGAGTVASHYKVYRARLVAPSYTANFTGNFSIAEYYTRVWNFTGTYTRNRYSSSYYAGNFVGNFSRSRSAYETYMRTTYYSADYIGNYTGTYTINSTVTRNSSYSRLRTSTYSGDYVGQYAGIFTGNYTGNYSSAYVATFTGNYTGEYTRTSERTRVSSYLLERVSTYTRDRTSTYDGTYSRGFTGNYTSEFIGNYSLSYLGNYVGATLSDTLNSTTDTYTLYVRVA